MTDEKVKNGPTSPNPTQNRMLSQLIAKVVYENTLATPPPEAAKKLNKYLSNPQTIDLAYEKIIERVQVNKTPVKGTQAQVISHTIKLLRTHLTHHIPSVQTLQKIDCFCVNMKKDAKAPTDIKTLQFIRKLIKPLLTNDVSPKGEKRNSLPGNNRSSLSSASSLSTSRDATASPASSNPPSPSSSHRKQSRDGLGGSGGSSSNRPGSSSLSSSVDDGVSDGNKPGSSSNNSAAAAAAAATKEKALITNFFALNKAKAKKIFSALPEESSFEEEFNLSSLPAFGPLKSAKGNKDLVVPDPASLQNHIETVSAAKKKEEVQLYRQTGLATIRKKGVQLFQYKYYTEQQPLSLSPNEMDQVVNSVVHPPEDDKESCLIASKILIKLLVDMYCADESTSSRIMLSLFFEMLGSDNSDTQIHAFNLLLNLSVHINLMEPIPALDTSGTSTVTTPRRVQTIQDEIFAVLEEMLLWMFHKQVQDSKVWSVALNCLLFFIAKGGRVDRDKLLGLDARLIPTFIEKIDNLSPDMYRHLMRIYVNMLFVEKTLDLDLLSRSCPGSLRIGTPGKPSSEPCPSTCSKEDKKRKEEQTKTAIDWVIKHYMYTRSSEVRGNLFIVLYHYIIHQLRSQQQQQQHHLSSQGNSLHNSNSSTSSSSSSSTTALTPPATPVLASSVSEAIENLRSHHRSSSSGAVITSLSNNHLGSSNNMKETSKTPKKPKRSSISSSSPSAPVYTVSSNSAIAILEILRIIGAPYHFQNLFKFPPFNFVKNVMDSIQEELKIFSSSNNSSGLSSSVTPVSSSIAGASLSSSNVPSSLLSSKSRLRELYSKVDPKFFEAVLNAFFKLAKDRLQLEDEFKAPLEDTLRDASNGIAKHKKMLSELLHSDMPEDRKYGEIWLYRILATIVDGSTKLNSSQQSLAKGLFTSLCTSEKPEVRCLALIITERLLLTLKSKHEKRHSKDKYRLRQSIFKVLTDHFKEIAKLGKENSLANLYYMTDVIINLISSREERTKALSTAAQQRKDAELYEEKEHDSLYSFFLNGQLVVHDSLLTLVDIEILHFLFNTLPRQEFHYHAKVVVLQMIVHKCTRSKTDLEAIGGVNFFKKLLMDVNPFIAFYASQFIIEQLQHERKEEYNAIFAHLLAKAQATHNDKLLSNFYLQVLEIIELNTSKKGGGAGAPGPSSSSSQTKRPITSRPRKSIE
ncbi:Protein timeless [Balamuthia mandrillaris]